MVTLIPSSRNTSWSGEGRKSRTTFSSPSGSSVYLILAFIDLLAPPPVTGADDSNGIRAVREANRHDTFTDRTETVVPSLTPAMREIFGDHAPSVRKSELCLRERNAMLRLVSPVFLRVPFEAYPGHPGDGIRETPGGPYERMAAAGPPRGPRSISRRGRSCARGRNAGARRRRRAARCARSG